MDSQDVSRVKCVDQTLQTDEQRHCFIMVVYIYVKKSIKGRSWTVVFYHSSTEPTCPVVSQSGLAGNSRKSSLGS
jgi:hypothetical protein